MGASFTLKGLVQAAELDGHWRSFPPEIVYPILTPAFCFLYQYTQRKISTFLPSPALAERIEWVIVSQPRHWLSVWEGGMYHLAGHESCGLSQTNLTT